MKLRGVGLQGKFVIALLVAAALPFLVGLVVFESTGYRLLLNERGKLHQIEALALARALEISSNAQADILQTYLAADTSLLQHVVSRNRATAAVNIDQAAIETRRLEELWASLPADDPQLQEILSNPGSESIRRFCSVHPACAEILATDARGRLVAATGKASDYDQSDEEWWKTGSALPPNSQMTDQLRFDASSGVFSLDVIIPLHESGVPAGVVKMSADVTSLFTRLGLPGDDAGDRWEIVLPDGLVLASSKPGLAGNERLPATEMAELKGKQEGWALVQNGTGEARMAGFVTMGKPGGLPNAYILFSSRRDDVVSPLQNSFLKIGIVAAIVLMACALTGFLLIRHNILRPLSQLGSAARSIAGTAQLENPPGEDDEQSRKRRDNAAEQLHRIESIDTGDEIEALAKDLAVMTSRVLRYQRQLETDVAAKTAVIRQDLELAREFQHALLPTEYPEPAPEAADNPLRLQFAHFYQPAATVGGDFFDIIELDWHRTGILIADVMGHGARSALVTAILRALVRHHSQAATSPGSFLTELNRHLHEVVSRSGQSLFVTAFFVVLDTRACTASWAVAGHPAPLRVRRGSGKEPQLLWDEPPHQPALGLMADAAFETRESPLKPGDVFLLYTDGALEAENPSGEPFGNRRLIASFDEALDGPMAAMPAKVVCDVTSYQKRRHYDDDVCVVVVEAIASHVSDSTLQENP